MFGFCRHLSIFLWLLLESSQSQSISVGSQSFIVFSNKGMEFIAIDEQALFLYETSADSILTCSQTCHFTASCRIFNFDSQSHRCRIYEGDINTMGSVVASSSLQAIAGSIQLSPELFANRGDTCSFCENSRYLTCINSICECQSHTFFNGLICQSQKLIGAECIYDIECRNDRNLTCLSNLYCGFLSFNQPKFCPNVSWNPNGTTFASAGVVGANPTNVFVDMDNTIYVSEQNRNRVQVWTQQSINPTRTISGNLNGSVGLFVTSNGDIFVDNGYLGQVEKWTLNATIGIDVMNINGRCYSLFVDINNTLYCSAVRSHQVIQVALNGGLMIPTVIAGVGYAGSASNMLNTPVGIFIDANFSLYVADSHNNRIQKFLAGELNGSTVAGNGAPSTITLINPTCVVLDADGYLFIVDNNQHRVVGSGPNGFRCLVGCSGSNGTLPNQLTYPWSLSFDTYGNMFVADYGNSRIQKFTLATNSCVT